MFGNRRPLSSRVPAAAVWSADRARKLGWSEPVMVDDDLGRSGGGTARPGFERLLAAICEASCWRSRRRSSNGPTGFEFCGLVNCRSPTIRRSTTRGSTGCCSACKGQCRKRRCCASARSTLRQKARGELFGSDRIAKDPDRRVQEAIGLVRAASASGRCILRQEEVRAGGRGPKAGAWCAKLYSRSTSC